MTNKNNKIFKAAALFINDKSQLLISKDFGSTKWTILGGRIEKDETHVECLKREMIEELSAKIEVNPKIYNEAPFYPAANDPGKKVKHYYYFCKFLTDPKPTTEVEFLHWLSKKEVESRKFEFSEATKKFLLPKLIEDKILL